MAIIPNFNKIIKIRFLDETGVEIPNTRIDCPAKGRKPSIEINGLIYADNSLPTINITVRNLYIDIPKGHVTVEIKAGYEDNLQTYRTTLLSMYQESAGPDGTMVIQCNYGKIEKWLDATVNLNFDKGPVQFMDVLNKIKDALGTTVQTDGTVDSLTINAPFVYQGTAQGAITKLQQDFSDKDVFITCRGTQVNAFTGDGKGIGEYTLKYMKNLPQQTAGIDGKAVWTTVIGPWIPELRPGDKLTYKSGKYRNYFSEVAAGDQSMIVQSISFQFSTEKTNSMTVQGRGV